MLLMDPQAAAASAAAVSQGFNRPRIMTKYTEEHVSVNRFRLSVIRERIRRELTKISRQPKMALFSLDKNCYLYIIFDYNAF